jgi:uncharacterized protein (UPF0335 family)
MKLNLWALMLKIIKHALKLKKKDKAALAEEDSLIDLYRGALGV